MAHRMGHSTTFDCHLVVKSPVAVPPFEIVLRQEIRGLEAETRLGLPQQSFGARDLDARLVLMASDPRVGAALAPVAAAMTQFESLHIAGHDTGLFYVTTENASSTALSRLVEAQRLLYALSDVLTGAPPASGPRRIRPRRGARPTGHRSPPRSLRRGARWCTAASGSHPQARRWQ